ncbi:MAG: guanylate kinase [Lachnospiraceae bacterium]|nr:guanylate kinase [Lachnospiraceae bacterium]
MAKKGTLIVISGFSGAGKGTVVKKLVEEYGYSLSISATTREPREGEVDGKDYFFKSVDEFRTLIDYNGFIEWAMYVDNYYGTPRAYVEKELAEGRNVILEIEVQGAMKVKEQYPDAVLVFLTTKNAQVLKERLEGRGTEDEATINKRMKRAAEEVKQMESYEYIVINDDLDVCVHTIHGILLAKRSELAESSEIIEEMKRGLNS